MRKVPLIYTLRRKKKERNNGIHWLKNISNTLSLIFNYNDIILMRQRLTPIHILHSCLK